MEGEMTSAMSHNSSDAVTSSSPFVNESNGYDFCSISLFPQNLPPFDDCDGHSSIFAASQPMLTSGSPQPPPAHHQDLLDDYRRLLSRFREVLEQAQALRRENMDLKMANSELSNQLSLLLNAVSFAGLNDNFDAILEGLRNVCVGGGVAEAREDHDMAAESNGGNVDRVLFPKSISVRSNGYMKAAQGAGASRRKGKCNALQKVYVQGGKQPMELEVYKQGMFKTELCNKWQQTGTCPYGHHCQFAHGIEELRPVLRHPRYKTEVCRMVLNGDPCPYGHRCHFRHTLTHQEKLLRSTMAGVLNH